MRASYEEYRAATEGHTGGSAPPPAPKPPPSREFERLKARLRRTEQERDALRFRLRDPDAMRRLGDERLHERCVRLAKEVHLFAQVYWGSYYRYHDERGTVERFRRGGACVPSYSYRARPTSTNDYRRVRVLSPQIQTPPAADRTVDRGDEQGSLAATPARARRSRPASGEPRRRRSTEVGENAYRGKAGFDGASGNLRARGFDSYGRVRRADRYPAHAAAPCCPRRGTPRVQERFCPNALAAWPALTRVLQRLVEDKGILISG